MSLIWLDFHDFWPKFGHIYSFLQGIRIWGQKIRNFRPRREKLRKTNVKICFSIFHVFNLKFSLNRLSVRVPRNFSRRVFPLQTPKPCLLAGVWWLVKPMVFQYLAASLLVKPMFFQYLSASLFVKPMFFQQFRWLDL